MLETCFGTKTVLFLSKVKAAMFLLTVALILQVRHSFPSALEQSSSRALFLVVGIANTASLQYAYDKGNLSSVQRTNNGKTQTYSFTYDCFCNMLTAKVGSRTLTTNVYGLDSYIGTVYCGVEVTQSGLLAACHLVGVGNMRDALANRCNKI